VFVCLVLGLILLFCGDMGKSFLCRGGAVPCRGKPWLIPTGFCLKEGGGKGGRLKGNGAGVGLD
jgi:hypothetical protein